MPLNYGMPKSLHLFLLKAMEDLTYHPQSKPTTQLVS